MNLAAPAYANEVVLHTFSPTAASGFYLPGMQWLPLDLSPLLTAALGFIVLDASGNGSWSAAVPADPGLVGFQLSTAALVFDLSAANWFRAISNVVSFVIQ